MNLDDAFERSIRLLYRAARDDVHWPAASALIEEACGAVGNFLVVGEGSDEARVDFARLLYRGKTVRICRGSISTSISPRDEALRRRRTLPDGRLAHASELYTEEESKTSVAYNEGWRRLGGQEGLTVHFDEPDALPRR